MSCDKGLWGSRWRAGADIPFQIDLDRLDTSDLRGTKLSITFRTDNGLINLTKTTDNGISLTQNIPEKIVGVGKISASELPIVERTRVYFSAKAILPNGDVTSLTEIGQDWLEVTP